LIGSMKTGLVGSPAHASTRERLHSHLGSAFLTLGVHVLVFFRRRGD
jgi:hypothetical protein